MPQSSPGNVIWKQTVESDTQQYLKKQAENVNANDQDNTNTKETKHNEANINN